MPEWCQSTLNLSNGNFLSLPWTLSQVNRRATTGLEKKSVCRQVSTRLLEASTWKLKTKSKPSAMPFPSVSLGLDYRMISHPRQANPVEQQIPFPASFAKE